MPAIVRPVHRHGTALIHDEGDLVLIGSPQAEVHAFVRELGAKGLFGQMFKHGDRPGYSLAKLTNEQAVPTAKRNCCNFVNGSAFAPRMIEGPDHAY
jgi:hypothetical protein